MWGWSFTTNEGGGKSGESAMSRILAKTDVVSCGDSEDWVLPYILPFG